MGKRALTATQRNLPSDTHSNIYPRTCVASPAALRLADIEQGGQALPRIFRLHFCQIRGDHGPCPSVVDLSITRLPAVAMEALRAAPLRISWIANLNGWEDAFAQYRSDGAMGVDAYTFAALILAALPTLAIALRTAKGWRALIVFAAFLLPLSIWAALVLGSVLIALAMLGAISFE